MTLIVIAMIFFCIFICITLVMSMKTKNTINSEQEKNMEQEIIKLENIARMRLNDNIKLQEKIKFLEEENRELLLCKKEREDLLIENNVLKTSLEYEKNNNIEAKQKIEYFISRIKELENKNNI